MPKGQKSYKEDTAQNKLRLDPCPLICLLLFEESVGKKLEEVLMTHWNKRPCPWSQDLGLKADLWLLERSFHSPPSFPSLPGVVSA